MVKHTFTWHEEITDLDNIDEQILKEFPKFIPHGKTPKNFNDMTGKIFGRLKVLYRGENYNKWGVTWICQCLCGKHTILKVRSHNLISGNTNSCGCYCIDKSKAVCKKYNKYDLSGTYGIGYCSNIDKKFYFDLEDYDKIKGYCWHYSARGYIEARSDGKLIKMHRLIMDVSDPNIKVDHKYHDKNGISRTYDNRKINLRLCTQQKNTCNIKLKSNNTSGITGVEFSKQKNKWIASIKYNGEDHHLGTFKYKEDAVAARKKAEKDFFKDFQYKEYLEEDVCDDTRE